MNCKPCVASSLSGSQVISYAKIFAILAAPPFLNVPMRAQEAEKTPPHPTPAMVFQVLEHRRIEVDEQAVVLNRVAPPLLPPKPAAPAPPTAQEIAAAAAIEAAHPAKKNVVLFLSATVYGRKVTEISFFGGQSKGAILATLISIFSTALAALKPRIRFTP